MADQAVNRDELQRVLEQFQDPETGLGIGQTGQLQDVQLADDRLSIRLGLSSHSSPLTNVIREQLQSELKAQFPALAAVDVQVVPFERPAEPLGQIGIAVKSVIAVGAGKGGVGKSTIATALAQGLMRSGAKVGLMDADVYGPSIPHLLGVSGRPAVYNKRFEPKDAGGLKVMSMGFLIPEGEAVVWRGPMLHGAITQFLRDTNWGELDYLVIDMPPGTGDIALTLSQLLPLTGAVVVCTPQDVALLDAVKAIAMFRKVNIPLLGMVENMSYFICPDCDKRYEIFGSGGAQQRAADLDVPFLGEVPLNMQLRISGDKGRMETAYDDPQVAPFLEAICERLARNVADRRGGGAAPLPSLSVPE